MEVRSYHIRPYVLGIFPYIGLKNRPHKNGIGTSNESVPEITFDIKTSNVFFVRMASMYLAGDPGSSDNQSIESSNLRAVFGSRLGPWRSCDPFDANFNEFHHAN